VSLTNEDKLLDESRTATVVMPSPDIEEAELSFSEVLRTISKHRILILCSTVMVFGLVVLYTFGKVPVYESVARLEIDPSRSSSMGLDDLVSEKLGSGDSDSHVATEVKVIQSDTVAMHVIESLGLVKQRAFAGKMASNARITDPSAMSPEDRQHLQDAFQAALKVQVVPHSQMVEIRFRSTDPKLAKDVTNSLIDEYMHRNFQARFEGTVQVANWMSKQMDELQSKAADSQKKLADFQKQNNILGADENDNIVTDRLKQLNQQLTDAEADRIVKEARHRLAASGNPELIASAESGTTLQVLRTQQADLRGQLAQLTSKYGSGYPKVHELQSQLSKLDVDIANEVHKVGKRLEEEYLSASKTESMLRDQFNEQKTKAYKLNENAVQYEVLKHEVETSQELHDTLQLKLKEAGVTAGLTSSYISVVDRAQVPANPVEPKKTLNLTLGLLGGLFFGLVFTFVIDSLDDTVQTSEDAERMVRLPVVGTIPLIEESGKPTAEDVENPLGPNQRGPGTINVRLPKSAFAEAIRSLRSSLLLTSIDHPPKVLVVTSADPGQGKSTVSANLAAAFAQNGSRVLLVDADLRRPMLHNLFDLRQNPGLTSILSEASMAAGPVVPIQALPNLQVLTSGPIPPMPAELFASRRFRELIKGWAEEYDQVIIDSPPLLAVTDALILGTVADGVLLIARSGVARKKALQRVANMLRRANINISGMVLNGVNMRLEHYYYSSYSKYGYRADDEYTY